MSWGVRGSELGSRTSICRRARPNIIPVASRNTEEHDDRITIVEPLAIESGRNRHNNTGEL
ncbi:uncharacterized protein EI90DRAFT_3057469 [Cantharellus anzutake]|uniref:uncharacterized protein n=1 Tax=Cantharellus anzutake TaxID=1750568 RepID=UPI0019054996|nr:uncharacterized protein EI90DRAFT_3057469 [Cantharellus anzutake]KAF8331303.1 hypothetical protein EI90DRAFT_3057469 [Cantharellus anzutake]